MRTKFYWCSSSIGYCCRVNISAMTAVFTAVAAENTDDTAVINTAATSVKFSLHRSKMSFIVWINSKTFWNKKTAISCYKTTNFSDFIHIVSLNVRLILKFEKYLVIDLSSLPEKHKPPLISNTSRFTPYFLFDLCWILWKVNCKKHSENKNLV